MPPEEEFAEPRPRKEIPLKKGNLVRTILIISAVLVILAFIFIAYAQSKHPEWLYTVDKNGQTTLNPTIGKIILGILIGGGLVLSTYLIIKAMNKPKQTGLKQPVAPDRAEALFKENFALKYNIECVYNSRKQVKAYEPAQKFALIVNDKIPYFHAPTGDNFLLLEIEVREGNMQGLHTIVIPIDRGEQIIKDGYYRLDTHTPRFQFRLDKINFPMSSIADKRERMQLAVLEGMGKENITPEMLQTLGQQPNIYGGGAITTPLDAYEGSEQQPNLVSPYRTYTGSTYRRNYRRPYRRY